MKSTIIRIFAFFLVISGTSLLQLSAQEFTAEEQEMLRLVNELRQQNGREPVQLNKNLNKACFDHSKDMGENNYFDHTGRNGSKFGERARNAGYKGSPRGENIAAGNSGVAATFRQWETSPGHRRNILNPNVNEMGIGHANVSGSRYRHYWTQIFGKGDPKTLSTETIENNNITSIYPNPASTTVHIDFSSVKKNITEFSITTLQGQVVKRVQKGSSDQVSIDISSLPAGVYLLSTPKIGTQKIVKI